jgi:hypothetical protein
VAALVVLAEAGILAEAARAAVGRC